MKSTTLASSSILPKFPGSLKEVRDLRPAPISPLPLLSLSYHSYIVYSSVVRRTPPHISIRPMHLEVALNRPYLLAPHELRISSWRAKMARYIAAISIKSFVLFSRKVLFCRCFSTTCFPLQQANTKSRPLQLWAATSKRIILHSHQYGKSRMFTNYHKMKDDDKMHHVMR